MGDLSDHFSSSEFACQCGCGYGTNPGDVSPDLIQLLEEMRLYLQRPIMIRSGCRCRYHNGVVGGVAHSRHVTGEAADIGVIGGEERHNMIFAATIINYRHFPGAQGIGIAKTFIHVDVHMGSDDCPRPAAWSY